MKTLTIYGVAVNSAGKLGLIRDVREMSAPGVVVSKRSEWTGHTFKTQRVAMSVTGWLNGCK